MTDGVQPRSRDIQLQRTSSNTNQVTPLDPICRSVVVAQHVSGSAHTDLERAEGITVVKLHRSRYDAIIMPDLRQLRHSLCLTVADAAAFLREPASLIQAQEQAGLSADHGFVSDCARRYVSDAATRARSGDLPPMTDSNGTPTAYWLRVGLGLQLGDGVRILGHQREWVEAMEMGSRPLATSVRRDAWSAYADWADRRLRRYDHRASVLPQPAQHATRQSNGLSSAEIAKMQQLAYAPQLTAQQAEAKARRLLGLG